jgi:hypothetical protein
MWLGRALATCAIVCGCGGDQSGSLPRTKVDARAPNGDAGDGEAGRGARDAGDASAPAVPVIPVGLDAYRQWDRLPYLKIGARTYMRSTYDRAGGNEAADASHFLRQEATDRNVVLDVQGPGILYFARANHWHGSPWHYEVDGADHVISESSTRTPTAPVADSVFLPELALPSPLTFTWSATKGADLNWVPIPFLSTFTLSYGRTHYGTGYFIYQSFPEGADNLTRPIAGWNEEPPAADVLELIRSAGSDIAPTGGAVAFERATVDVPVSTTIALGDITGKRMIRAFKLRATSGQAVALSKARLRMTWDGRAEPSVDVPVGLFFGAGSLENGAGKEWLVRGLLSNIHYANGEVELATYFPMPFSKVAHFEISGGPSALTGVAYEIRSVPYDDPSNWTGYFHATYRDHGTPTPGRDLVILDTTATEGGGDYCGSFNGMSFVFSDQANLRTLEGDPRFFFDDSESPQAYGTGTEEWAGGGDYWGGQNMTLPLAGHPTGVVNAAAATSPEDLIESAYRFLLADAMPFAKNARIQLEHGGEDESTDHYQSVAYWYGTPGACLELTDSLHVGDAADEANHRYESPTASPVETLTSRYELGVDTLAGVEIYPETTDTGRFMTGTTEFSVALRADNLGVLLRRKLDYGYADQRAEVFVADDRGGAPFVHAGFWYLAGSNRAVYSNPPGELDPPTPLAQSSNRRFRDDEFLVPRALTEGKSKMRVRIVHSPIPHPLLLGDQLPDPAWSEFRYAVYSWVLPRSP